MFSGPPLVFALRPRKEKNQQEIDKLFVNYWGSSHLIFLPIKVLQHGFWPSNPQQLLLLLGSTNLVLNIPVNYENANNIDDILRCSKNRNGWKTENYHDVTNQRAKILKHEDGLPAREEASMKTSWDWDPLWGWIRIQSTPIQSPFPHWICSWQRIQSILIQGPFPHRIWGWNLCRFLISKALA